MHLALFRATRRGSRFDGARHDAQHVANGLAAHLRDEVDPDVLRTDIPATVHAALEPTPAAPRIRQAERRA